MRNMNTLEVTEVSGGLSRTDASTLLGAYLAANMFTYDYPVAGFNLGSACAMAGSMIAGGVIGRAVDHLVEGYVFPLTDSVTP